MFCWGNRCQTTARTSTTKMAMETKDTLKGMTSMFFLVKLSLSGQSIIA